MTPRRRTVLSAALATAVMALTASAVLRPPRFVVSLFATPEPSPVAGEAVPAVAGSPVARIAAAGDTGTGDAAEQATADRMAELVRGHPYDGLVLLGDLIYDAGKASLVDTAVTDPFSAVLGQGAELLPVLGNHDYDSSQQQQILSELGRSSPWYVASIGPVRVVVLDSNRVDDPEQTRWLRDTLAEPQPSGSWTVVAMHHPAYSAGYHGSDQAVREAWSPLFAEYDVPLVLAGHEHDYQRSTPQDGVTYLVSGAGAKLRRAGHDDFTAVSSSTLHYLDLLFYDDRLVVRAIDQSGRLVDMFTLPRVR